MASVVIEVPEEIANRLAELGVTPEEAGRFTMHRLGLLAEEKQAEADLAEEYAEYGESLDADEAPLSESESYKGSLLVAAKLQPFLKPLIALICQRPEMFVGTSKFGTFWRVGYLLTGYAYGFSAANGEENGDGLSAFRMWLADRYWKSHRFPRNLGWEAYIEHFGADDTERFRLLQSLYDEFVQTQIPELASV
jgi:hypothetical protein